MLHKVINTVNKLCQGSTCRPEVDELVPTSYVMSYRDARSFLQAAGPWLRAEARAANPILSHSDMQCALNTNTSSPASAETQWVVCWSLSSPEPSPMEGEPVSSLRETRPPGLVPQLCLILMAGESHLGPLPIFLFSPNRNQTHSIDDTLLVEAMKISISRLAELRSPDQIHSIFGPAPLVQAFVTIWDAYSMLPRQPTPLRRVKILSLTHQRVVHSASGLAHTPRSGSIRTAIEGDLDALTNLSQLGSPFLAPQQARKHAHHFINRSQVWVHEDQEHSEPIPCVASLCEVGRRSSTVAVITNLVTATPFRRRGHGTRLLDHVAQYLFDSGITEVVVYIAVDTPALGCIFRRLGFEEVDDTQWMEWAYGGATNVVPW